MLGRTRDRKQVFWMMEQRQIVCNDDEDKINFERLYNE